MKTKSIIKKFIPRIFFINKLNGKADRCVLLTFDDGPDPEITPLVLKKLNEYNARAIFFIPGKRIKRAPSLLKKILDEGHLIGNHSFIHDNEKEPNCIEYYLDVKKNQRIISEMLKISPIYYRAPGGRLSFKSIFIPKLIGLKLILWSLDVNDWECKNSKEAIVKSQRIEDIVTGRDIILLHDDNRCVLNILDRILPFLKEHGFDLYNAIEFI